MTDEEMLRAFETGLRDACEEAEFTRLPKDLAYCRYVANRLEKLRADLSGYTPPMEVEVELIGGRVMLTTTMRELPRFGA
jgi:hypothetical protein